MPRATAEQVLPPALAWTSAAACTLSVIRSERPAVGERATWGVAFDPRPPWWRGAADRAT